ncbi:MAG: phosphate signaling complex protein PhoU [Chloroflexi bacterium]|nr:phosphate signaling complex protein PhoU [Chloroflexota bacterium]
MSPRQHFDRLLSQLRTDILSMADMVDQEMSMAMAALKAKDVDLAQQVFALDERVNAMRYQVERTALLLISTQQPMARDARAILAALFINVILERMGDKAKSIAKAVPHILLRPNLTIPNELQEMADQGQQMLRDAIRAYADDDDATAIEVANRDDEVDQLYGKTFFSVLSRIAKTKKPDKVEAIYELLRTARDLERFADYATDIAERVDFMVTGHLAEVNVDDWEMVRQEMDADRRRKPDAT